MELNGLTKIEVEERVNSGKININNSNKTKTIKEIFLSNIFTYFNILNISLGVIVLVSGIIFARFMEGLKNSLFLGTLVCNTTISIIQEILSKKTIDKLSVLSSVKSTVIRDGKETKIEIENIVLNDLIKLNLGDQVVVDSIIKDGFVEVNESFITGESKTITKNVGDNLLSGSFIVGGNCIAETIHVGKDNYINVLSSEAKKIENNKSVIFNSFEKLIKILSYILIPLGISLFINQYKVVGLDLPDAIMETVAALIGMVPEGLVLLTSSVMAVSVVKLSKQKVLVQQLYCIETLARVNVICLDKTGTITTGNMKLNNIINDDKYTKEDLEKYILKLMNAMPDKSPTFSAIRKTYSNSINVEVLDTIPFSSERKFSACKLSGESLYIGAPEYVLKHELYKINDNIKELQEDYRVLVIAKSNKLEEDPSDLDVIGYVLIEDEIRPEAMDTLKYFKDQGVKVKIISGDNYKTVTKIANKVGLNDVIGVDTTTIDENNLDEIVKTTDIFGRVTPHMKKKIILALKKNGYTVAMTGDGVNDVLALKEADCSVAMASGSDAAKSVSQLVLLDSNFASMPKIVEEGRRTINNIERSSSLLLVKTLYTILLIFTCLFFKSEYFFVPIQLTLITSTTIGIPSFILALEPNKNLVDGKNFLFKIIKKSLPGSLTVFIDVLIILLFAKYFNIDKETINVLSVLLTGVTGFIHLFYVSKPFNTLRTILLIGLVTLFSVGTIFFGQFFELLSFTPQVLLIFMLLVVFSISCYQTVDKIVNFTFSFKITRDPDII